MTTLATTGVTLHSQEERDEKGIPLLDLNFTRIENADGTDTRWLTIEYGVLRIRAEMTQKQYQSVLESLVTGRGQVSVPVGYFQTIEVSNDRRCSKSIVTEGTFNPRRYKFE